MKSLEKYIIGPSHLHPEYTSIINEEINNNEIFNNCILDGHRGIPIWSRYIYDNIEKAFNMGKSVVWMVSDFKFNNFNYDKINSIIDTSNLFLDEMGHPGNIDRNFLNIEHLTTLGFHSINVIDKIVKDFKDVKLIFWCLYTRSRIKNSSYPKWMQYNYMRNRYKNNIIDIDLYTSPEVFSTLISDSGGHPNKNGYLFLDYIINNNQKEINLSIDNDFFTSKRFSFLRSSGEFISDITLNKDGTIGIYENENEKRWIFENEQLIFLSNSGIKTTIFNKQEIHGGNFYMIGDFIDKSRPKHILRTNI